MKLLGSALLILCAAAVGAGVRRAMPGPAMPGMTGAKTFRGEAKAPTPEAAALPVATLQDVLTAGQTRRLPVAAAYLAGTDAAGCAALAAAWMGPPVLEDLPAWKLLMLRWVNDDGLAALTSATAAENAASQDALKGLRLAAWTAWGAVNHTAALAAAGGKDDIRAVLAGLIHGNTALALELDGELLPDDGLPLPFIARVLASRDPAAAMQWMDEVAPPAGDGPYSEKAAQRRCGIALEIAKQMALTNPEGAIRWVTGARLQNDDGLGDIWRAVLGPVMEADPARAAGLAGKLPASRDAADLLTNCYQKWALSDPAAVAASARLLPSGRGRAFALSAAAIQLAGTDLPAAKALLADIGWENAALIGQRETRGVGPTGSGMVMHSDTGPAFAFRAVLLGVAGESPAEALAMLKGLSASAGYWGADRETADSVIKQAAAKDPAGTAQAMTQEVGNAALQKAFGTMAAAWMERDPAAARAWVDGLPAGEARDAALEKGSAALGKTDPAGALDWVAQLAPGKLPETFQTVFADNPQAAASSLEVTLARLPAKDAGPLIGEVARNFGMLKPQEGIVWLNNLPDEVDAGPAARTFAAGWAGRDRAAASTWAAKVEPGPLRDHISSGLVAGFLGGNPDYPSAIAWASSITDDAQRREALQKVLEPWRKISVGHANAALEGTSLSAAEKSSYVPTTK